jgi:hypothetical protein
MPSSVATSRQSPTSGRTLTRPNQVPHNLACVRPHWQHGTAQPAAKGWPDGQRTPQEKQYDICNRHRQGHAVYALLSWFCCAFKQTSVYMYCTNMTACLHTVSCCMYHRLIFLCITTGPVTSDVSAGSCRYCTVKVSNSHHCMQCYCSL